MLREEQLHEYQRHCVKHIIENPYCALLLEMGLGKTVSSLTAIDRLLFDYCDVNKVLIIAPKRVARDTWGDEIQEWAHLKHMRVSVAVGTERQRDRALMADADVYTINRENVAWLIAKYGTLFPFDMVVIDELSSFKSSDAVRFKELKKVRPMLKRVVGLTGTPAPNGYMDLWAQMFLIDRGERLGKFKTHYKDRFFTVDPDTQYSGFPKMIPKPGAAEQIHELISDICISMKAKDYLQLPQTIHRLQKVHLTDTEMKAYENFERSAVMELPTGEELTAVNAGALRTKLVQFANGAVYDEDRSYHTVHEAKLEVVEEIVDTATSPIIIFYRFKHDLERLQQKLRRYNPRMLDTSQDQRDWNAGKIQVLLAHPASMGHGLNLQRGGNNILWFGDPDSLELYQQANARLDRQGQKRAVVINHLCTAGTIDEAIMQSLVDKTDTQEALMQALKVRIDKYKKP